MFNRIVHWFKPRNPEIPFQFAAERYLRDARDTLKSYKVSEYHVALLLPFIGERALGSIHDGTLEPFIKHRLEVDGVSLTTVNRSLEIARRILLLSHRKYRHDDGTPWNPNNPRITINGALAKRSARRPYPLTWDEQDLLFAELPAEPNRQMAMFKVNTGTREQEVCRLRWQWEVPVSELDTSVFVVPGRFVKNNEDRIVVLNRAARAVIEERRGIHPEYVFTWRRPLVKRKGPDTRTGTPLHSINNTAWGAARARAAQRYPSMFGRPAPEGFAHVRVHDLKHTFGRRLRAAGVVDETRKALLGHTNGDITTHYSGAELAELVAAANKIDRSQASLAITLLRPGT